MTDQDPAYPDDPDATAGERAIGLLARRAGDLDDPAVVRWGERLAPLYDLVPAATPGAHVWDGISRRIESFPSSRLGSAAAVRRSVVAWRTMAIAASALAAAAVVAIVGPYDIRSALHQRPFVATLGPDGSSPLFTVVFDPSRGALSLAPMGGPVAGPHVPQLWFVPADAAPVSLGLVDPARRVDVPVASNISARFASGGALAISLEPPGGSPTGAPTGPVVAHGSLQPLP
jgi:anti-sigma-K factor RskA